MAGARSQLGLLWAIATASFGADGAPPACARVLISVDRGTLGSLSHNDVSSCVAASSVSPPCTFRCAGIHAALQLATNYSATSVEVTLPPGTASAAATPDDAPPYKIRAPSAPGDLVVRGAAPPSAPTLIDGVHNNTVLDVSGGSVALEGIAFANGQFVSRRRCTFPLLGTADSFLVKAGCIEGACIHMPWVCWHAGTLACWDARTVRWDDP